MPVEIMEMVVRAEIRDSSSEATANNNPTSTQSTENTSAAEITEQLVEMINRQKER